MASRRRAGVVPLALLALTAALAGCAEIQEDPGLPLGQSDGTATPSFDVSVEANRSEVPFGGLVEVHWDLGLPPGGTLPDGFGDPTWKLQVRSSDAAGSLSGGDVEPVTEATAKGTTATLRWNASSGDAPSAPNGNYTAVGTVTVPGPDGETAADGSAAINLTVLEAPRAEENASETPSDEGDDQAEPNVTEPWMYHGGNDTLVGEEVAFEVDPALPGIRNLTTRDTQQVLFETVQTDGNASDGGETTAWSFQLDAEPSRLLVLDDSPAALRAHLPGDGGSPWELTLADGVAVRQEDGAVNETTPHGTTYELDPPGDGRTYLSANASTFDRANRTFTVRDHAVVGPFHRPTVEAVREPACFEGQCLGWNGFEPSHDPGDSLELTFENEAETTHSLWVADADDVADDRPNSSREDALAGVEAVAPGEEATINLTIPEDADTLYLWDDTGDREADAGMQMRWHVVDPSPG